jgi:V8-like Glu-specific endopeptidase
MCPTDNFQPRCFTRLVRKFHRLCSGASKASLPLGRNPRSIRPELECLEQRTVPTLSAVAPGAGYPYTAIVELQATFPDGKSYVGSGAMVDSFHVLTAGHVVYSSRDGGFARQIEAIPELNGHAEPFGVAYATYERTFNAFINYDRAHPGRTGIGDQDIGLITLNRNIGYQTSWLTYGYDNNNADFAPGAILNTVGYPAGGGYNGRQLERSYGPIAGLSSDGSAIEYRQSSIATYGGQSGSPVYRYIAATNSRVIYAVHVAGSGTANSLNFGTRITQSIFNTLQQWRNADPVPGTSFANDFGNGGSLPPGSLALTGSRQSASVIRDVAPVRLDAPLPNALRSSNSAHFLTTTQSYPDATHLDAVFASENVRGGETAMVL